MNQYSSFVSSKKDFDTALIVGKFCPLHKGHELLIKTAFSKSRQLIIISYSKPELPGCEPEKRARWLESCFPEALCLVFDDRILHQLADAQGIKNIPAVPDNNADGNQHRIFVGWICKYLLKTRIDVVFTSEDYGDGFAQLLSEYLGEGESEYRNVKHICVDKARKKFPVSGTKVREDIHGNRNFVSGEVYADFVERVCFLGGESTGKTTLAAKMAAEFKTKWVPEFGRELWEKQQGRLQYPDLLKIAETQISMEQEKAKRANRWLFCDTSPLTTLFYSEEMFRKADSRLLELANRRYSQVFLCAPDFRFHQDGTRRDEMFREKQHLWYMSELKRRKISYHLVQGSLDDRVKFVIAGLQSRRTTQDMLPI